jgi:hypothetical protein
MPHFSNFSAAGTLTRRCATTDLSTITYNALATQPTGANEAFACFSCSNRPDCGHDPGVVFHETRSGIKGTSIGRRKGCNGATGTTVDLA